MSKKKRKKDDTSIEDVSETFDYMKTIKLT